MPQILPCPGIITTLSNDDSFQVCSYLGLYSLSGKRFYRQISRSLEDTRMNVIQWKSSGEAREVSLKLQNLVHFHAPFFTNHVYFAPHDRPPLLKGRHFWVAFIEGFHCNDCIALKYDRHLGSTPAEMPVKFQSDWKCLNLDLVAARLREILW